MTRHRIRGRFVKKVIKLRITGELQSKSGTDLFLMLVRT